MPGPPSTRTSFPSASGEPSLRRLGLGSASGAERPVRAQIVVLVVLALTIVAVPMYLVRRPNATKRAEPSTSPSASAALVGSARPPEKIEASKPKLPERVRLGAAQRVRCGATPKATQEGNLCDGLPVFEDALAKSIVDENCVAQVKAAGTINFVLNVDFARRALHVFPGASGEFRGPQARRVTNCVKRALPKPDWEAIRHQYKYYTIAVLATFTPDAGGTASGGPPKFD
ncbi:MAG TPA: hypothetical protein VFQ61_37620 [Polyangiaceae bacterium]|nr:hypothetical protein [Polyangiaceae bacterium]